GIRDFHVTVVQTCALPISVSRIVYRKRLAAFGIDPFAVDEQLVPACKELADLLAVFSRDNRDIHQKSSIAARHRELACIAASAGLSPRPAKANGPKTPPPRCGYSTARAICIHT